MKKTKDKFLVLTGHSESGDDYGPWIFNKKPSDKDLEAFLRKEAPGEFEDDGPGEFGSYLHIQWSTAHVYE